MKVVSTAAELAALDLPGRRAVVMTMGALHEGHLSLVREARRVADHVVVTIFVNPLQFDPAADLVRYPRTLDEDCELLAAESVSAVFAPEVEEVYPGGEPIVTVASGRIGEVVEGAHRPGHFDGVLTVVLKLMNLTRPDVAVFGEKDAQQLIAIRTMVRDLNVPVEVVGAPIVRDDDGLALSSRNRFLSAAERARGLRLSAALRAAVDAAEAGSTGPDAVTAAHAEVLDAAIASGDVELDYVEAQHPVTAEPVAADYRGRVVFAIAARVGETRLIDNMTATITGA